MTDKLLKRSEDLLVTLEAKLTELEAEPKWARDEYGTQVQSAAAYLIPAYRNAIFFCKADIKLRREALGMRELGDAEIEVVVDE